MGIVMNSARNLGSALVFQTLIFAAPAAMAAACVMPKTQQSPVPYTSPQEDVNIVFRLVKNPDAKKPQISHQRYRVKSIKGDSVRWFREPLKGKGPIEDVTLYRAFARTEGNGWEYRFDTKAFDRIWPLQQGKKTSYVLSARKDGKEIFKLRANFCVRGSKQLKVVAGEYKAHLIDFSQTVVKGAKKLGWDLIEVQAWYVPEFGTALLIEDRVYRKGKVILVRRREATKISTNEARATK